jgi:methanogenic corrinoid protein MtbC1
MRAAGIAAADSVVLLADEAGLWVAASITGEAAPAAAAAALAAAYQTPADQRYHIQFLAGALATGQHRYFTDYVAWLSTTLTARAVPLATVARSFALIARFYGSRLPAAEAAATRAVLRAGILALTGPDAAGDGEGDAWPEAAALADRLVAGDTAGAWLIATAAADRRSSYIQIATRLFQPALYQVGRLWQQNRISVAEEHLATEISRVLLARLLHWTAPFAPPIGRKALFAAVEDDRHVLGLQVVAEAFQIAGWTVQYLGASTPTLPLVRQVDAWRPDVIGLSVSLSQRLPILKQAVTVLRGELGGRCPTILIGGRPTNQISGIWRWTGADAWGRDAETAVTEMAGGEPPAADPPRAQ